MMRVSDISTVYVLDSKGKVLSHDKTGEWGKIYNDELTKKILSSKKKSMYISQEARGYIYSMPLASSATLCIGISSDKIDTRYGLIKKNAAFVSVTILCLSILAITVFLIFQFKLQFQFLEGCLRSLNAGTIDRIDIEREDEFAGLSRLINQLIDKCKGQEKEALEKIDINMENSRLIIKAALENFKKGLIITNSDNKIIYVNNEISPLLSHAARELPGQAHTGCSRKPAYLDILKKSTEKLNLAIEQKIEDHFIKIVTIGNERKEIVGSIIQAD